MRTLAIVALLVAAPMAGCLGTGGEAGTAASPSDGNSTTNASEPAPEASPAATSHVHDRWDGASEKVVVDDTVTTSTRTDTDPRQPAFVLALDLVFGPDEVPFRPPEGRIVPPGTDEVVVEAEWPEEAAPNLQRQAFLDYRTAADADFQRKELQPTPATYTIDTDVEDADGGHAQFSLWEFRLELRTYDPTTGDYAPSTEGGLEVDVTVTAHRVNGSLPKEPPHPDWYGNGSALPIHASSGSAEAVGAGFYQVGTDGTPYPAGGYVNGSDHRIVPPGTKILEATINWSDESPSPAAVSAVPQLQYNFGRSFEWRTWTAEESGESYRRYVLPVEPDMTDGIYAGKSRWRFRYAFLGQDTGVDEPVFGTNVRAPYHFDGSWSIDVTAYDVTDPSSV